MLEAFKLVGAIVAFATGAFTVWDRWARGRPLAWVTAIKYGGGSYKYLRVANPGPGGLFIRRVDVHPPLYGIAKDHSVPAMAAIWVKGDVQVLLEPGKTHDLVIVNLSNHLEDAPSQRVYMFIHWRKTTSSWLWQLPVPVVTSTHDIKRIADAANRGDY
jgi:hypothetical protein